MGDIDVDIFLETLKQLIMSSKVESNIEAKHWLESLEEEIKYMRGFLKVTEKKRNKHAEVMNLVRQIKDAVVEVENFMELSVVQAFNAKYSPQLLLEYQHYLSLERKKIKTLMAEIKQIYAVFSKSEGDSSSSMGFLKIKNFEGTFYVRTHKGIGLVIRDSLGRPKGMRAVPIGRYLLGFREAAELGSDRVDANYILKGDAQEAAELGSDRVDANYILKGGLSSSGGSNTSKETNEKVVVGFKEEVETVLGKLHDCGEGGQLEIISIVGAAGGGKTTLAREVYDHPLTSHTFEIRAWVNVSQDYDKTMKRNLLIRILEVASQKKHGDYEKSSEDTLGEDTLKCLKGKKYLIVMDDIWGIEAWNDIQRSLPKECNGSKVLFTSRLLVVPNSIHCVSHCLAPLTKSCSWELLQKKVFGKKCCPPELVGIGEHIAEKCEGLPLAIVAIAGILAVEEKTLDMWEEVSKHLSSIIAKNQNGCMEILELSYNHLPLHLKACFVYIGGFPEDYEILVRELIWLWIAEGFIQQSEGDKSLEDIAKDYLSSLIDRSLVMVARKRSFGGIKVCRIHDLLRELCLKKAEEDDFLVRIYGDDTFSPSAAAKHRRLFISSQIFCESFLRPFTRNIRSLLCLSFQNSSSVWFRKNLSFFVEDFKLLTLRVLCFPSAAFHGKIERMYHLRYLAFQVPDDRWDCLSPFTSYLLNLETLTFQSDSLFEKTIPLPPDIFKMVKLRHLYAKRGVFKYYRYYIGDPSIKLDSLQTLHSICPCEKCLNFLVRTPNLKKLGFYGELISNDLVLMLPDLEFLKCLETLSFNNCRNWIEATSVPPVLKFPPTITRLTLKNTRLNWEELSILQTLPSLEVLKLSDGACRGQIWNTSELEGFSQLKYLRLQDLDIREWNASEDQFPRLEVLVVKQCFYLERIPIDFANLNELREIEVKWSSRSAEESAREIQEEQRNTRGDDDCINLLAIANTF